MERDASLGETNPVKNGFTLMELLVALVIVGILVSIAYPGYRDYVTRARRSEAQAALLDAAIGLERYFSEHTTYANATVGTGNAATDILNNRATAQGWYTITLAPTDTGYALTAIPRNAQASADTQCQTFTLNNLGEKGVTAGPSGTPTDNAAQCWQ